MKCKSFNLKIGAVITALALVAGIAAIPAINASANSAQKNWYGSSASGMFVTDENCPVKVESEVLTFDIRDFPATYYYEDKELDNYEAKVTAHYNFYNPADYDVNMTLAFPFGESPSYVGDNLNDTGKYSVTAGGEKIESTVRHTLSYGVFNADKDVAKILDGYKEDEFYSYDMPVHYYVCKFSDVEDNSALYLKSDYDKEKTAVFYSTKYTGYDVSPSVIYPYAGNGNPISYVRGGSVIYLFVVGENFESEPKFSYGQSWPLFDDNSSVASEIIQKDDITYKDLMLAYYNKSYGVSEIDWYNAATEYLSEYGCLTYYMNNSLLRWYEYQLTIPAGGRLENEVTAPLYPDVNGYYSPAKYSYRYLLSPAKCWASFGSLDIVVNTPYYLSGSSVGNFEKVEGGYTLHLDGLPDGELDFTLCEGRNPVSDNGTALNIFGIIVIVLAGVVMGLQIIAAIPLIIVFAVTGKFSSKPRK